jgi:hypothetical protein
VRVGEGVGVSIWIENAVAAAAWMDGLGGSSGADCVSVVDGTRVQPTASASNIVMQIKRFKLPPRAVSDQ